MIQLLFTLMLSEMASIMLLLFRNPLRKLLIMGIDRAKRGRAPLVVKSVAATVFVIMMYYVYAVRDIQTRPLESLNPTDQILLANYMLQASLMGTPLFLSFYLCVWFTCAFLLVYSFFWFNIFLFFFYGNYSLWSDPGYTVTELWLMIIMCYGLGVTILPLWASSPEVNSYVIECGQQ